MKTRIGTSHFVSFLTACQYYKAHGETAADVERKVSEGLISIGAPALNEGETLSTDEGRYVRVINSTLETALPKNPK